MVKSSFLLATVSIVKGLIVMSIYMSILIVKFLEEHSKLIFRHRDSQWFFPIVIAREWLKLDFRPHYFDTAVLEVPSRKLSGYFEVSTCS